MRLDISDGSWRKDEDIFAERFELQDIAPLMQNGLNIQESQSAILLEGHIVGFAAIDATIVEVEALNLAIGQTQSLGKRDILHRATDNLGTFALQAH